MCGTIFATVLFIFIKYRRQAVLFKLWPYPCFFAFPTLNFAKLDHEPANHLHRTRPDLLGACILRFELLFC